MTNRFILSAALLVAAFSSNLYAVVEEPSTVVSHEHKHKHHHGGEVTHVHVGRVEHEHRHHHHHHGDKVARAPLAINPMSASNVAE